VPIPEKYLASFESEGIYHIYNRTNNREKLFLCDNNRKFFLTKYEGHLSPFLDNYCWSLLPNHFHFLVKIKEHKRIITFLEGCALKDLTLSEKRFLDKDMSLNELIVHEFKRFFQSYSMSFNSVYERKGNLLYRPFKRVEVIKDSQLTQAIVYIHANAVKHHIVPDFRDYRWSSWQTVISAQPTTLLRAELYEWFGGKDQLIQAHLDLVNYYYESEISIEE
jgi:putative transposase